MNWPANIEFWIDPTLLEKLIRRPSVLAVDESIAEPDVCARPEDFFGPSPALAGLALILLHR
jgi:hypothetical protein